MNVSPMLTRDDDGTRRFRNADGDCIAAVPFDTYVGRTDALLQIIGRSFTGSALLTAPELRAVARACEEVADQIERQPAKVAA